MLKFILLPVFVSIRLTRTSKGFYFHKRTARLILHLWIFNPTNGVHWRIDYRTAFTVVLLSRRMCSFVGSSMASKAPLGNELNGVSWVERVHWEIVRKRDLCKSTGANQRYREKGTPTNALDEHGLSQDAFRNIYQRRKYSPSGPVTFIGAFLFILSRTLVLSIVAHFIHTFNSKWNEL